MNQFQQFKNLSSNFINIEAFCVDFVAYLWNFLNFIKKMSSETCASHRLFEVKMYKSVIILLFMNQFQQFKKLIIKFHQYEAFCVDFVAFLEKFWIL